MGSHLTAIIGDPYFWGLIVSYWLVANAISALPIPDTTSGKFYGWFFKFSNGFAANLSRAAAGKIPGTLDNLPTPGQNKPV
jgi:hypothetical protein